MSISRAICVTRRAQLAELVVDVGDVLADRRRDLEHGLHQLGPDDRLELAALDRRQDRVDVLHEVERRRVEQHVLLLDAERVRIALAEGVLVDAAVRGQALARDARRDDAVHAEMYGSSGGRSRAGPNCGVDTESVKCPRVTKV